MRIQETDAILKDSKINRKHVSQTENNTSVFSKTWRMITSLFKK
jgi:hypothetical protein